MPTHAVNQPSVTGLLPQPRAHLHRALAQFADTSVLIGILVGATLLRVGSVPLRYVVALLLAIIVFHTLANLLGLYRPTHGESPTRQFFRIAAIWAATYFVLLLAAYLTKTTVEFSRLVFSTWLVLTPLLLSGWRIAAGAARSRLQQQDQVRRDAVVYGDAERAARLAAHIAAAPGLGVRVIGQYAATDAASLATANRQAPASDIDRLVARAQAGEFGILYVVLGGIPKTQPAELIDRLSDTTVSVYVVPDMFADVLARGRWTSLNGMPMISVFDTPFWGAAGWLKRLEDLALASTALVLAAVPMALIAIAVRATSPGPVLFRQRRCGLDGTEITVLKFRTMTVTQDGDDIPQARPGDTRLTSIGGFLRRFSLDELPQFWNVLRGEMSVIGPRPHALAHHAFYRQRVKGYMLRHKVKPGITGWAQVNGWRGETADLGKMERRIEHDLWYISHWSFWLDMKIVWLTLGCVLRGENAH